MKLKEIENYLEKKVRLSTWTTNHYVEFDGIHWINPNKEIYLFNTCLHELNYWEEYIPKKKITLHRYTYKTINGNYFQGAWRSEKETSPSIVLVESKEVEIDV